MYIHVVYWAAKLITLSYKVCGIGTASSGLDV